MLLPETVAEISLIFEKEGLDKLTSLIVEAGIYHPLEPSPSLPGTTDNAYKRMLYEAENRLQKITLYLRQAGVYRVDRKTRITVKTWREKALEAFRESDRIESVIDPIIEAIRKYREKYRELEKIKQMLEPIKKLDLDIEELQKNRLFHIHVCYSEKKRQEEIKETLDEFHAIYDIRETGGEDIVVLLAVEKGLALDIEKRIRVAGCTALELPESLPRNPAKAYALVEQKLEEYQAALMKYYDELRGKTSILEEHYALLYTVREALRFLSTVKHTDMYAYTKGFIPSKKIDYFEDLLEKEFGRKYLLEVKSLRRGAVSKTPSYTTIPRYLRPFHMLVTGYGHPREGEIVPTLLVAITFPLLYSLMFPDAGHAMVIMLFGLFLMRTSKGREGHWNIGLLAVYLGAASLVTGILSGEFFGPLTHMKEIIWHGNPPLESPIEAANAQGAAFMLITIALRIASAMLITGTLLGLINRLIAREWIEALGNAFPKFLAFLSATYPFLVWDVAKAGGIISNAMFSGATEPPAMIVRYGFLAAVILLIIVEPAVEAKKHGWRAALSAINMMFMEVFEVILMTIGNTASFLRLLGLNLAHSGLMYGFTILATMLHGGTVAMLGSVLIYIIGNILTIALEGIIVYAHTLRLHYYEWFTKFYSGTGIPFQPVKGLAVLIHPSL